MLRISIILIVLNPRRGILNIPGRIIREFHPAKNNPLFEERKRRSAGTRRAIMKQFKIIYTLMSRCLSLCGSSDFTEEIYTSLDLEQRGR